MKPAHWYNYLDPTTLRLEGTDCASNDGKAHVLHRRRQSRRLLQPPPDTAVWRRHKCRAHQCRGAVSLQLERDLPSKTHRDVFSVS